MAIRTYLSIINLNVNRLNAPIRTQSSQMNEIKKRLINIVIFLLPLSVRLDCVFEIFLVFWSSAYKRFTSDLKIHIDSVRKEKIYHANGSEKKAGVAILISDKADFITKL